MMADVCNSVTVTEFPGKPGKWNAINPASEKPKFGRGTSKPEMKGEEAVRKDGDKWLPLVSKRNRNRTWLTR